MSPTKQSKINVDQETYEAIKAISEKTVRTYAGVVEVAIRDLAEKEGVSFPKKCDPVTAVA